MTGKRTRFARLYSDGSINVSASGYDFVAARKELVDSHDDPSVELLEVELVVIRTHGRPKLQTSTDLTVTCPTCGEEIYVKAEPESAVAISRRLYEALKYYLSGLENVEAEQLLRRLRESDG